MPTNLVQLTVGVTPAQAEWLRRKAEKDRRSVSNLLALYIEYGIHESDRLAAFTYLDPQEIDVHDPRR